MYSIPCTQTTDHWRTQSQPQDSWSVQHPSHSEDMTRMVVFLKTLWLPKQELFPAINTHKKGSPVSHSLIPAGVHTRKKWELVLWQIHGMISFHYLDKMVNHEGSNPSSSPLRVHQEKRDVSFIVLHIWHHKAKGNDNFLVENNNTEVWILQALWQINS